MDWLSFEKTAGDRLATVPAAAHQETVALEVLRAAWRWRRLIIGLVLGAAVLGGGATAMRAPRYPAEALIELRLGRSMASASSGETPAAVVVEASSVVLGEARIIRSRMIAQGVVERLGLADDPTLSGEGSPVGWAVSRLSLIAQSVAARLGSGSQPSALGDGSFVERTTAWLRRAVDRPVVRDDHARRIAVATRTLLSHLLVETDNRSYLISITYTAATPQTAARIANAVGEEYLARRLEISTQAAAQTAEWLNSQIATTESQLRLADTTEAAFRQQSGLVDLSEPADGFQQERLRSASAQLDAARNARIGEEARLSRVLALMQADRTVPPADLGAMPQVQAALQREIAAERDVTDLQVRLGPNHPGMQQVQFSLAKAKAALNAEMDRGVASLRVGVATARAAEQDLQTRLDSIQHDLIGESGKGSQLRSLQIAAASLRDQLQQLLRSRDQAMALRELHSVPASLIVPAQPLQQGAGLNPLLVAALGSLGGLLAGIVLAALAERLDHGLRSSSDVMAVTGLRCLGMVPELSANDLLVQQPCRPADTAVQVMFDEATRLVASSVGLFGSRGGSGGQVVLITSALPAEGRSTLCAGLARALSINGRPVVLINGLPRRLEPISPEDASGFDPSPDVVSSAHDELQASRASGQALVVVEHDSGSVLSLDILGSPRLDALLEEARKHFAVILIEGPPILLMADALVLGRLVDTVIHVARWAETAQHTVHAAMRRMQEHGVLADGVVLTRVDIAKHARLNLADDTALHLRRHGRS